MKSPTPHLFFCYFFFHINTFPSLVSAALEVMDYNNGTGRVIDYNNGTVRVGSKYYFIPSGGTAAGWPMTRFPPVWTVGRHLAQKNASTTGAQFTMWAVHFSPADSKEGVVHTSTDQNIRFNDSTTVWAVERDESRGRYLITTGGVQGNPGAETVNNWFKIEEYQGAYKLVFCPTVCSVCNVVCGDVGVFVEGAQSFLGVTLTDGPPPLRVMFRKA